MLATVALSFVVASHAAGLQRPNPFAPPQATLHYAPDRTCDLLHVFVDVDVDYPNRAIKGRSQNTLAALRNGIESITIHAGTSLDIQSVKLDGKTATFKRDGRNLIISTPGLKKGQQIKVETEYTSKNARGTGFGSGGGGWHWINAGNDGPDHVGFWTQGETEYNSQWAPTWDYPNDMATSETHTTVPDTWDVVGNGSLISTKVDAVNKRKTFVWRMTQPHATYLLSLVGGPFDIKKDKWEGVDLWYVVPRGQGFLIDDSFGHTKDMLTFYSKVLGVKYAWPKYAQNAMWDFGGGMENVSATTLGAGSLTEKRDGYFNMDSLNAHELGHQWFGDLVTCMHWGDTWLNESFATFMDSIYREHSRGPVHYQYAVEGLMQGYFQESTRYKRPLSTKMYSNADSMFDSHSYPKGAAIMHTLRRQLGDEAFFAGLNHYLTKWRHTPVESVQLRRAFVEATGINVEPFWAQWIEKPGHPVLNYSWTHDNGKLKLTVKQVQDTSDGTPIYDLNVKVGFMSPRADAFSTERIHVTKADETFEIPMVSPPLAVVLDSERDFLREIPVLNWSTQELPYIMQFAPGAPDRDRAMTMLLSRDSSPATLDLVVKLLLADTERESVFHSTGELGKLAKDNLRAFWIKELAHKSQDRAEQAVLALAKLPSDPVSNSRLRATITETGQINVVVQAINALANLDPKGSIETFKRAQKIVDRRNAIKNAATRALEKAGGN